MVVNRNTAAVHLHGVEVWERLRELDLCVTGKVDVRLLGKGNSNSHGARPVHPIITMKSGVDQ